MNNDFILNLGGKILDLRKRTGIMGILNVTPDSFSDGGRYILPDKAIERGIQIAEEGSDIIDIGGESVRPGSDSISVQEEIDRIMPVIEGLLKDCSIPISVDTYKSEIAECALKAGIHMVNDISALRFDSNMVNVIRKYDVPCVLMHIKGTPKNMQVNPEYKDFMVEIKDYFKGRIDFALENGIGLKNIIIDPGIGFGKRLEDNFMLLRKVYDFKIFRCPILIGPSRKSFIGITLNLPPEQRFEGTAAAITAGILNGANIVRVHDVEKSVRVVKITDEILHRN
ncbi:dihydropteroate synthase [candidate division KSB1 bacterium]